MEGGLRLALGVAFLAAASASRGQLIEWSPESSTRERVRVAVLDADGRVLEERFVALDRARLPRLETPPQAVRLAISTPVHAACTIDLPANAAGVCKLEALRVSRPFGKGEGRVWIRRDKKSRFAESTSVPQEWGGGFVLPPGSFDLVAAPRGSPARLRLDVDREAVDGVAERTNVAAPAHASGSVLGPDGNGFRGTYQVAVIGDSRREATANRWKAWAAFVVDVAAKRGRSGDFELDPLPEEPALVVLQAEGYPSVSTRIPPRSGNEPGVRLPAFRLSKPAALTVRLRPESERVVLPADLFVSVRALAAEGQVLALPIAVDRPAAFRSLLPGRWKVSLRRGADARKFAGFGSVVRELADEPVAEEFVVRLANVSGRVVDDGSEALAGC